MSRDDLARSVFPNAADVAASTSLPRVLLVDDREANLVAFEGMLGDLDCELSRATSGTMALELLLKEDFALILMDVQMPGMDGVETTELVHRRRRSSGIPIILLTAADPSSLELARGYAAGAVDYVLKPIVPEILRAKVRTFLDLYRTTEELRQSREYLRLVLEKAFDAFVAIDADGNVVDWNPQAEKTFGWTRAELLGKPISEAIIPEKQREAHRAGLRRFLETGTGAAINRRMEMTARHKDGHEFPVEMTISTLRLGGTRLFTSFLHDISERRASEQALRRAVDAAESYNRELESFSYSVSHDLRAPLRAITGFSRLLMESSQSKLDAEETRFLQRIQASSRRMGELIDDLLSLAKVTQSALRPEPLDLARIGRDIVENLRKAAPGRDVDVVIPATLPATGDARFVRIVLENLLANAWKFTARHPAARIELGMSERDGRRAYFVRDDGAGFDMTYAGKLFQVFQRLHENGQFEGSGVGLATVARIVQRHGGRVWAEGEIEKGATFYFTLGPEA